MTIFPYNLLLFLSLSAFLWTVPTEPLPIISTESDPDAFIHQCVNVISGEYCEATTDLAIAGPDALILQRFYSSRNAVNGSTGGGWRILPQRFLVIGKELSRKSFAAKEQSYTLTLALTGERSGGIFPYTGWRDSQGRTRAPLKIDVMNHAIGAVNTFAKEISGQTNRQNHALFAMENNHCELFLGDGTIRIYKKTEALPSLLLGEELTHSMADQVLEPEYFLLTQEILPSGNQLFFIYNDEGHLSSIELTNKNHTKTFSWIHFKYVFEDDGCQVIIETSDTKTLIYHLAMENSTYKLIKVEGSHTIPVSYVYQEGLLVKKILPENDFTEIEYQDGKVAALKTPHPLTGSPDVIYSLSYLNNTTRVSNAIGINTRYSYNSHFQLTGIDRYDDLGNLYRIERNFWGNTQANAGRLLGKAIGEDNGRIRSYRSFHYDKKGNVVEEKLFGNLTGKQEVSLKISVTGELLSPDEEECHVKRFNYSEDRWNLLTTIGDVKGNQTQYIYKPGTNLLTKKLIYDQGKIKKRTFHTYNDDGVLIKTVEDDGSAEEEGQNDNITERHITEIQPKETLPGVGLPLIVSKKAFNIKHQQEILLEKCINNYDSHAQLTSWDTYDARNIYAFSESKAYNNLGQPILHIDRSGRKTEITYDTFGNKLSVSLPDANQHTSILYDYRHQPIQITETNGDGEYTIRYAYDLLGRKISSADRFGNTTYFEYDAFDRLIKVIHPEVPDENNQAIRPTFAYTYDIFGNVLTIQDPKGFLTAKTYNLRGDPTSVNYPDGSSELFKYDVEGSLHRSLDRNQMITVYEYDYLGRTIYEEVSTAGEKGVANFAGSRSYQYNGFRCIYEKVNNYVKKFGYGAAGRLTSVTEYDNEQVHVESRRTEMVYGSYGRLREKKIWFGMGESDYRLECFQYDKTGNLLKKQIKDSQGNVLLETGFSYNIQNQCIEEYLCDQEKKNSILKTSYNSEGDPIHYVDALGQETKVISNYAHQNALGQNVLMKKLINPFGAVTEIEFDALSRVHAICKKDPNGLLLSSQKILYDSLGNKACEINDQIVDGTIIDSQKTVWVYGPNGRLEEEIEAAGSPCEKRTSYLYNSWGKLTEKKIAGTENALHFTYNKKGQLQTIEAKNNQKHLHISNSYTYDRNGNIIKAHSLHGKSVNRNYNAFNQLTQETIRDGEGEYTLAYSYDRMGRIKEIVLPDQSKIAYSYDALFGRSVRRLSKDGKEQYIHTYDHYDKEGKLLEETLIGYLGPRKYQYDLCGQKIGSQSWILEEQCTRDPLGRLSEITDKNEYTYNHLSQIVSEKDKSYAYDSLDNIVKINSNELTINALNQLTSFSKNQFTYDPQGNLMKKVLDGEESNFESNLLSQLVYLEKADKTAISFSYDPFGRLLVQMHLNIKGKIKRNISTSRFFYLGNQEIGSLTQKGEIETLKVPGLSGDSLASTSVAFELHDKLFAPLHDVSGNVISLYDPYNQTCEESYRYTAFGEETIFNSEGQIETCSQVLNPWRFAEKRMDQNTGLICFGFRFYDPGIGRWISPDPAGFADGPNLYTYLHNDPINHMDRFGLATEKTIPSRDYMYGEYETHCYCEKHRTCKRGGDIGKTTGPHLPKITYHEKFEDIFYFYKYEDEFWQSRDWQYYEHSKRYDLSNENLPNLPNDLGIGFINGMDNNFDQAYESLLYISKLAGGYNIHGVYNATHGKNIDSCECKLGLLYIATEPVKQLHNMWNSYFEKSSANAKFLQICHSQGAIHTRNALLDYPLELRERILVVAIAPGGYIYNETCAQVIHYCAPWWRDLIPLFDVEGRRREKMNIVTLSSHSKAPIHDHAFLSPTYMERLQKHIKNYINTKGGKI